jgi:hypothetical protein
LDAVLIPIGLCDDAFGDELRHRSSDRMATPEFHQLWIVGVWIGEPPARLGRDDGLKLGALGGSTTASCLEPGVLEVGQHDWLVPSTDRIEDNATCDGYICLARGDHGLQCSNEWRFEVHEASVPECAHIRRRSSFA